MTSRGCCWGCGIDLLSGLRERGTLASVVDLLISDSITEISMRGGSRVELSVAGGEADPDTMANVVETMRAAGAEVAFDVVGEFRARFRNPDLVPVWNLPNENYDEARELVQGQLA